MARKASIGRAQGAGAAAVEEYLAAVPEPARSTLLRVREAIRSAVPEEATEEITYRMPGFRYKGPLVAYAAFPDHCSLFVMSSTVLNGFEAEIRNLDTSKGTIRFPVDKPLAAALIRKLVKARMAENEARQRK